MVPRRPLIAGALAASALAASAPADAASRKVGLGDYRWSAPQVAVDLGETVTWVWAGPDTRHSVSPVDPAAGLPDSDPQPTVRTRRVGDRFAIRFTQPGTYAFRCRLHSAVTGTVAVSDVPGTDAPSPDPDPVLRPDRTRPRLIRARVTGRSPSLVLRFDLDETSRIEVDVARARGGLLRSLRRSGHPGRNAVRIGRVAPGRYELRVQPVDRAGNRGRERAVRFAVRAS